MKLSLPHFIQAGVALAHGTPVRDVVSVLGVDPADVARWLERIEGPDGFEATLRVTERDGSVVILVESGPLTIEIDHDPTATLNLPGPLEIHADTSGVRLQPDGTAERLRELDEDDDVHIEDVELEEDEGPTFVPPTTVSELLALPRGKVARAVRSRSWDAQLEQIRAEETHGRKRRVVLATVRRRLRQLGRE